MNRKFYTKWILVVIILLIPIVGTYILLYLHTTAPYREESAKTKKLVQLWESEQQKKAQIKGKTSSPQPSAENIIQDAEKSQTNTARKDNKTTSTEKTTPKMSPFGLGPYPEIPKD